MKIERCMRIMTSVRDQRILSVCGRAVTSRVERGLQGGHRQTDTHTARLNMKINLLLRGQCPCGESRTALRRKGKKCFIVFVNAFYCCRGSSFQIDILSYYLTGLPSRQGRKTFKLQPRVVGVC